MKVKYETIFERLSINGNMISFKYKKDLKYIPSYGLIIESRLRGKEKRIKKK